MTKLMQMFADRKYASSGSKIGGYGVGLKCGGIAVAQTVIVISTGKTKKLDGTGVWETQSIGVLSNEPYEAREERPYHWFVTVHLKSGKVVDGLSEEVKKKEVFDFIERQSEGKITERSEGVGTV